MALVQMLQADCEPCCGKLLCLCAVLLRHKHKSPRSTLKQKGKEGWVDRSSRGRGVSLDGKGG